MKKRCSFLVLFLIAFGFSSETFASASVCALPTTPCTAPCYYRIPQSFTDTSSFVVSQLPHSFAPPMDACALTGQSLSIGTIPSTFTSNPSYPWLQITGAFDRIPSSVAVPVTYTRWISQYIPLLGGICGPANGVAVVMAPVAGLCTTGTASAVTGAGPWNWDCSGTACAAPFSPAPGLCGSSNGGTLAAAPATAAEVCSVGTPSAITGTGPWSWSCAGGTTVLCSADSVYSNVPPEFLMCGIGAWSFTDAWPVPAATACLFGGCDWGVSRRFTVLVPNVSAEKTTFTTGSCFTDQTTVQPMIWNGLKWVNNGAPTVTGGAPRTCAGHC